MSVSSSSKKLTWLLGLGLGLAGISGLTANALGQQPASSASRSKSRPIAAAPKESQKTIQQYRQMTADAPLDEEDNPVKSVEVRQASRSAQPSYQRSPAANRAEAPGTIQQTGHYGHSHGHSYGPSMIDDPTVMPMGDGCDSCGSGSCGSGDCGGGCLSDCLPCNYWAQNGFYIGGEYLNARATFSEPTAYTRQEQFFDNVGNVFWNTQNFAFDTNYQSSYRAFAGYRWGNCGESINFNFFNFNNFTSLNAVQADPLNGIQVAGPLEQNPAAGQRLWLGLDTSATTYDLDYSKRIPICSCNADACSCGDCPPWAVTWNAGSRVGDFEINSPSILYNADGTVQSVGNSLVEFVGAGPKIGLEGRRFFGQNYRWSAYGKSNLALLLGQYDVTLTKFTPGQPFVNAIQTYNYTRIVPVIDLEVGVSRQIGKKTMLTAGYFFQAYFDVSTISTIRFAGNLNNSQIDDSNIMSFDGLMVRIERTF